MCLGNRAPYAVKYVNQQLETHWKNSSSCVEKHGTGSKPTDTTVECGTCLSEFYHGSSQNKKNLRADMLFYGQFGIPRIEFVCNHDLILYFDLKEGHFVEDTKASAVKGEDRQAFKDATVALRVEFVRIAHKIESNLIGPKTYDMHMIVLKTESAKLSPQLCKFPGVFSSPSDSNAVRERKVDALNLYLKAYLALFKRAGYHVLYGLPEFDHQSPRMEAIDFSLTSVSDASFSGAPRAIRGIDLNDINFYLRTLWHDASAHIDFWEEENGELWDTSNQFCLAEHHSNWPEALDGTHEFHVHFGPPQMKMLCEKEAVLFLDLEKVEFYVDGRGDKPYGFENWKVAFVVDFIYRELDNGIVRQIVLNYDHARFLETLSTLEGKCDNAELFKQFKSCLVQYMIKYYLLTLASQGLDVVYSYDPRRKPDFPGEPGDPGMGYKGGCTCKPGECDHHSPYGYINWFELFQQRHLGSQCHEFDMLQVVTQGTINGYFRELLKVAEAEVKKCDRKTWSSPEVEGKTCIAEWSHRPTPDECAFHATFKAMNIEIVTGTTLKRPDAAALPLVILYVSLNEGHMKLLDGEAGESEEFTGGRVAFEVELVKRSGLQFELVMDLENAKYKPLLSSLPGVHEGRPSVGRRKDVALVSYMKSHYLKALEQSGNNVLYRLLLHSAESGVSNHCFAPTSIMFQIYPFVFGEGRVVQGCFGEAGGIGERNMIAFGGMHRGRKLPSGGIPRSINWVCNLGATYSAGTVCISSRSFLEEFLLANLARLSESTTVVLSSTETEVDGGIWNIGLTTWQENRKKRVNGQGCPWKITSSDGDCLGYQWHNNDVWTFKHQSDVGRNGRYSISCDTLNKLHIPTQEYKGILEIKLSGEIQLSINFDDGHSEASSSACARWECSIRMQSDRNHGVTVRVTQNVCPEFYAAESSNLHLLDHEDHTFDDALTRLQKQLPKVIPLNENTGELQGAFQGMWPLLIGAGGKKVAVINPQVNKHGDLLLDMGNYVESRPSLGTPKPSFAPQKILKK